MLAAFLLGTRASPGQTGEIGGERQGPANEVRREAPGSALQDHPWHHVTHSTACGRCHRRVSCRCMHPGEARAAGLPQQGCSSFPTTPQGCTAAPLAHTLAPLGREGVGNRAKHPRVWARLICSEESVIKRAAYGPPQPARSHRQEGDVGGAHGGATAKISAGAGKGHED